VQNLTLTKKYANLYFISLLRFMVWLSSETTLLLAHFTNSCFELTLVTEHQGQVVNTPALYSEDPVQVLALKPTILMEVSHGIPQSIQTLG
jgi:hypothetical protein